MTKIVKNNQTIKPPKRNLKDIYNSLKHDANALLAFMFYYKDIDFHKKGSNYICNQSSGLKAIKTTNGYTLHNHSSKLNIQNGNISTQIRLHTSNVARANRANEQYKILERLGVDTTNNILSTVKLPFNLAPKDTNLKSEQTACKSNKSALSVKFGAFSSYCGKSTLEYFKKKTGATKATLTKYNVSPVVERSINEHTFKHGSNNFAFAFSTSTHTKIKQPNNKEYPYQIITKDTKTTYCFGLDQLPKNGNDLVICAGETDTICTNHHLNKHGIFAICFGGESQKVSKQLLNSLKKRFKRVFVLYDHDNTGIEQSKLLAFKNGLIWVNLTPITFDYPKINDVCDIYGTFQGEFTAQILRLINSNSRIEIDKKDVFSLAIPHISVVNFDSYIAENEENIYQLVSLIMTNKSTCLWSAAGTGKSWGFISLIPKLLNYCGRIIQVVPTKAIGGQIHNTTDEKYKGSVELLQGKKDKYVTYHIENSKVIISTYDSILNIPTRFIETSILFVDEAHQLCNDIDYRNKAMTTLYSYIEKAHRVVYLTATPNWLFFSPSIEKYLGKIHLIQGKHRLDNEIKTTIYTDATNKKHNRYFIEDNIKVGRGQTTCIKLDDTNVIDKWNKLDIDRQIKSDYFTSKTAKRSTENPNYQEIQQTGKLKTPLDYLYYTTLMEAGVSFKFPVGAVCVLDTIAPCKLVQLATRPRYDRKTGINKSIQLHIFLGKQKEDKGRSYTSEQRLELYIHTAQSLANQKNGLNGGKTVLKLDSDFIGSSTYKDKDGFWQISIFYLLHRIFKEQQAEQTPELLVRRLQRYDKRFKIQRIENLKDVEENSELNDLLKSSKVDKEAIEKLVYTLLSNDAQKTVAAYTSRIKKAERKEYIRGVLKLPIYANLEDYISEFPTAFSSPKLLGEITNLLVAKTALKQDIEQGAKHIVDKGLKVAKNETQRKLHQLRTKLAKAAKKGNCELSANDQIEYTIDRAIIKKFDQIKNNVQKGKIKGKYTGQRLANLVNAARPKGIPQVSKGKALKRLRMLYELKYNTKTHLYVIGNRLYSK